MTYLLLPGRHIVTTAFQEEYLGGIMGRDLTSLPEMVGNAPAGPVTAIVFAVTSCNKSNSRYNPLPFETRAIVVYEFARTLQAAHGIAFHIVGIPHYAPRPHFAALVLKEIGAQSDNRLALTPHNTVVFTSTPSMIADFQGMGFAILPGEYDVASGSYIAPVPNVVVQRVGEGACPVDQIPLSRSAHAVFTNLPDALAQIRRLYNDPILTEQGDLTETRNYATYARSMSGVIDIKYDEIKAFIVPGKIVDEGCADGVLIERIARDFPDSDIIGIDLSAEMLARANEAKRTGAFGGAFVFFKQQNLMSPVPETQERTIDTIICNSTLHELWSYGEKAVSVRAYLRGKFRQLRAGGRLVIRDVVGPEEGDRIVELACNATDGAMTERQAGVPLEDLSTHALFLRFLADFRPGEPRIAVDAVETGGAVRYRLPLRAAMEFITKMCYTDNWLSEMHEEFCFWSFTDWRRELEDAGFRVLGDSRAYANQWRVENQFKGRIELFDLNGLPLPFPVTNMVLAGEKAGDCE